MFDNTFSSPQLCLYTNTLSGFSLNRFDPQNEMVRPTLTSSGSVPEGVSGKKIVSLWIICRNTMQAKKNGSKLEGS